MKRCRDCSTEKPADGFYRTSSGSLMHICRDCHKARMKLNRLRNPRVQEYDRARAKTEKRKALSKEQRVKWRTKHPDAYKAQTAAGNAVRDGRLLKLPCEVCGDERVHAHHNDYSKPLEVVWLCAKCHHRLHAIFPQLRGHQEKAA
jgi:ribosomal protein S27AE